MVNLKSLEEGGNEPELDDPELVSCMFTCMYTGDYQLPQSTNITEPGMLPHDGGRSPELDSEMQTDEDRTRSVSQEGVQEQVKPETAAFDVAETASLDLETDSLTGHAKIYAIGWKYDYPFVREIALQKFRTALQQPWHNEDFVAAIPVVFESTPDSDPVLRQHLVSAIFQNFDSLVTDSTFEAAVRATDGLEYQLLKGWSRSRRIESVACWNCTRTTLQHCSNDGCEAMVTVCKCSQSTSCEDGRKRKSVFSGFDSLNAYSFG